MYVKYNGFSFFFAFYSSSNINFWHSSSTEVSGLSAYFIRRLPRLRQTRLPFFTSFKTSSQKGTLPKASGLSAHYIRRLPRWAPYPKPFKQTLRVRLAFLLLVCLRKQAFATASKQKSLSLCDRLCSQHRSQFGRFCS